MEEKKMLPIGIEDFEEIRTQDFYYVDKTGMIRDMLKSKTKVTLFTRPRRFGKSLNMSMLARFFSLDGDKSIFDGLEISKEKELCEKYMGKYPVVFISLKDIEGDDYEEAYCVMADLVVDLAARFDFLADSKNLSMADKERYKKLLDDDMRKNTLTRSLKLLCGLLRKHYGVKAVLLIDEYDVVLVIKRFVSMADNKTRDEIEALVAGEAIKKDIREDLTYSEIYNSIDNLWSLLFMTGYLTQQGGTES